jgi:catechol 2,3-dioxygenase-like lactoylglutathione lyase family enzyme
MGKRPKQPGAASSLQRWEGEGGAPRSAHRQKARRASLGQDVLTPLYYFNICTDQGSDDDPEGLTLPNLEAARHVAVASARALIAAGDRKGEDRRHWRYEIMDRANHLILTVAFSEALAPRRSGSGCEPDASGSTMPRMEQRISVITLGVRDLDESRSFYERLGWKRSAENAESVVFFQLAGMILSLFPRHDLAKDAQLSPEGSGFCGVALAYNARTKGEVDEILKQAEQAGARILKPGQAAFWGGYSGYFADLDGIPWEVAWNPGLLLSADGSVTIPERS